MNNNNNSARVNGQLGRHSSGKVVGLTSSDQMSMASSSSTISVTESMSGSVGNPSGTSYQHQHLSSSNSSSSNTSTAQLKSTAPSASQQQQHQAPHPFVSPPLFCVPSAIVGTEQSILHSTSSNLLPVNFKEGGGGGGSYQNRAVGQQPPSTLHSSTNPNLLLSSANAAHSLQHTSGHILATTTSGSGSSSLPQDNHNIKLGSSTAQQSNISSEGQQQCTAAVLVGGSDFKTCTVKMGEVTTIEIVREKLGLGLSIVGGADTPLVSDHLITTFLFVIFSIVNNMCKSSLFVYTLLLIAECRHHSRSVSWRCRPH